MLKAEPLHWYSWSFRVLEDDVEVTRVRHALLRSRGSFDLNGCTFTMRRLHPFGAFLLEQEGREIARATPLGLFERGYEITFDRRLTLRKARALRRRYTLYHGDLRLGELRPYGPLRRACFVDFPASLPLSIRVFLIFLVMNGWRRQRAAASG